MYARLVLVAVLVVFAASAVPAFSSSSSVSRHAGISLRRVWMKPGVVVPDGALRPVPLRVADPVAYRRAKAEADAGYLRWLGEHPQETGRPAGVSGSLNHAGLAASDETDPGTPPDTTGAVGPDDYVEMVNSMLAVYSKTDLSAPTETIDEASFVGLPGDRMCDGNIEWDQEGGRWLYSASGPCRGDASSYGVYFGWSRTSSPSLTASNWCQYVINTGSNIDDYPKLGHDDSQIIIGVNEFLANDNYNAYPKILMLDKPANGDTSCPDLATEENTAAVLTLGSLSSGHGPWTPVAANLADSSAVGYVVADDLDGKLLHVYTVGRDSNQANVLLHSQTVSVQEFCVPPSVPQKGTKDTIESLDARFTQAVAVTDPSTGHEGIWTQHTVSASCKHGYPRGPSVVRWYELAPTTSTPTQTGTVRGTNGAFAFMGAISPSADGQNAAIFYNRSSSTTLPDFRVSERHPLTASGGTAEDLQLATSTSRDDDRSCVGGPIPCRWGDYNGASPDPSDPSLIWGTGEITVAPPDLVNQEPQWGSENAAIDVTPDATYGLQVKVTDRRAGTGSVSSSPEGIDACTSSCSYDYVYGTAVQLIATPGAHSVFHWSGDCSGTGACNVPMGGPQNVTATFLPQPEILSYRQTGKGWMTYFPRGRICFGKCAPRFDYGTRVRLRATAAVGWVFKGWSGACRGHSRSCRVTMKAARSVRATFAKQ